MILPRGITGFSCNSYNEAQGDLAILTNEIARENYFKILDRRYYTYCPNYDSIIIEDSSKKLLKYKYIKILIHAYYPYLAFTNVERRDGTLDPDLLNHNVESGNHIYVDEPFLIKCYKNWRKYLNNYEEVKFTILSEYILNYPLSLTDRNVQFMLQNLSKEELHQLKYWNPDKIGDIIFNFWD